MCPKSLWELSLLKNFAFHCCEFIKNDAVPTTILLCINTTWRKSHTPVWTDHSPEQNDLFLIKDLTALVCNRNPSHSLSLLSSTPSHVKQIKDSNSVNPFLKHLLKYKTNTLTVINMPQTALDICTMHVLNPLRVRLNIFCLTVH